MPYASETDLIERFGEDEIRQLSDREGTGEIDSTVIERALSDATAEIDGFLASRYPLPLDKVPTVLVRVACDIARYLMYPHATDQVSERYRMARKFLTSVSKGEVSLGLADDGSRPQTADGAEMHSDGRTWDRDKSKGFI